MRPARLRPLALTSTFAASPLENRIEVSVLRCQCYRVIILSPRGRL